MPRGSGSLNFSLHNFVVWLRQLMMDWYRQYRDGGARYSRLSSLDQQAMLDVLRQRRYTFFPMPPSFNYRETTMPISRASSHLDGGGVVVIHDHILDDSDVEQRAQIRRVAQRFADRVAGP